MEVSDGARIRFDPLPPGEFAAGSASDDWTPLPAPGEPPPAHQLRHPKHGPGAASWIYRTADGAPICVIVRYETDSGKKFAPFSYSELGGKRGWHMKALPAPRPLFGLDQLAAYPKAPVIVVEGEKAADAATAIFPNMVAVTAMNGAQSPGKADWTPLRGRRVVVWPDHDAPGTAFAEAVCRCLETVGAASVRPVCVPAEWPEKWDLADAPPEGVTIDRLRDMARPEVADTRSLRLVEPRTLFGVPVPERQWIVEDWLPVGAATLLYGDGGTGKTLLVQQLMTSCATQKPWLGLAATPCRSLALFCEDDEAELHRRQDRINAGYGIDFDALDHMTWASCVGQDNALMRFDQAGVPRLTSRLGELRQAAIAFGARLLVIDTAADTFGGNENDRGQVRAFLGTMNALALEIGGAVLICAHPSRAGLGTTGDIDGGSTAWSNTARSRWSLTRPKSDGEQAIDSTDERVLARRKANYAAIGEAVRMRWQSGVLVPIETGGGFAVMARDQEAETVFIKLLCKAVDEGRGAVSASVNAANFAPKVFAARPDRGGFSAKEFRAAMERLFIAKRIRSEEYGRPNQRGRPCRIVLMESGTGV